MRASRSVLGPVVVVIRLSLCVRTFSFREVFVTIIGARGGAVLGKIAVAPEQPGRITGDELARGNGWRVEDVVCTSGPADRPFEEQHSWVSIALVVAGTFQYRSPAGRDLMTPGCVLLGSASQHFEADDEQGPAERRDAFRDHQAALGRRKPNTREAEGRVLRVLQM